MPVVIPVKDTGTRYRHLDLHGSARGCGRRVCPPCAEARRSTCTSGRAGSQRLLGRECTGHHRGSNHRSEGERDGLADAVLAVLVGLANDLRHDATCGKRRPGHRDLLLAHRESHCYKKIVSARQIPRDRYSRYLCGAWGMCGPEALYLRCGPTGCTHQPYGIHIDTIDNTRTDGLSIPWV